MQDKHSLIDIIAPEPQINLTSNGIMVTSERIAEPVVIPLDQSDLCQDCNSTKIDLIVTKEGVAIWSKLLKKQKQPRFVPFDYIYDLPGHTFIRIRNKMRIFKTPHGVHETPCVQKQTVPSIPDITLPPPPPPPTFPGSYHPIA